MCYYEVHYIPFFNHATLDPNFKKSRTFINWSFKKFIFFSFWKLSKSLFPQSPAAASPVCTHTALDPNSKTLAKFISWIFNNNNHLDKHLKCPHTHALNTKVVLEGCVSWPLGCYCYCNSPGISSRNLLERLYSTPHHCINN